MLKNLDVPENFEAIGLYLDLFELSIRNGYGVYCLYRYDDLTFKNRRSIRRVAKIKQDYRTNESPWIIPIGKPHEDKSINVAYGIVDASEDDSRPFIISIFYRNRELTAAVKNHFGNESIRSIITEEYNDRTNGEEALFIAPTIPLLIFLGIAPLKKDMTIGLSAYDSSTLFSSRLSS